MNLGNTVIKTCCSFFHKELQILPSLQAIVLWGREEVVSGNTTND